MFAQNSPKTVQINYKNYEVLPYDLDGTYDWYEAKEACDKLVAFGKSDWFLPDKYELDGLYKQKEKIGGFKNDEPSFSSSFRSVYWSSSDSYLILGWFQSFLTGGQETSYKTGFFNYSVRCIRKK